jgi:hypothetical protein
MAPLSFLTTLLLALHQNGSGNSAAPTSIRAKFLDQH